MTVSELIERAASGLREIERRGHKPPIAFSTNILDNDIGTIGGLRTIIGLPVYESDFITDDGDMCVEMPIIPIWNFGTCDIRKKMKAYKDGFEDFIISNQNPDKHENGGKK